MDALTSKQLEMMFNSDNLPPEVDLKAEIRKEHYRAELERLRAGYDGCGCSDCQIFYSTMDLSIYGERVKGTSGGKIIIAGRTGADLWDKYHQSDNGRQDAARTPPVSVGTIDAAGTTPAGVLGQRRGAVPADVTEKIKALAGQGLSSRAIAAELQKQGIEISYKTVQRRLEKEKGVNDGRPIIL